MYENQTFDSIMQRMLSNVSDDMDKREGSVIYDAIAPCALELESLYSEFDAMMDEAFGDTASREYLIRLCAERGITPYPATQATLAISTNIEVPIGTRFTGGDCTYIVTDTNKVECEQYGSVGNEYTGMIIPIEYVDGLTTATITSVLIYGEDDEDTEALRKRYLESFNERAFAGNKADYLEKTVAIAGVGSVKVTPTWNGAGSVKLTITDSVYESATNELITSVKNVFDPNGDGNGDGLAPIGHVVTVDTPEEVTINVKSNITFDNGYSWETTRTQIENAIETYLLSLRQSWSNQDNLVVRIAQIESSIIGVVGVLDVSNTTLNGGSDNITLSEYQIPMKGVVSNG